MLSGNFLVHRLLRYSLPKFLLLAVFCLPPAPGFAAGVVFSDGFEDGTTNKWQKDAFRDLCPVVERSVDGVLPHSGRFMLECNWNGLVPWSNSAAFSTVTLSAWPYHSEFLVRLWVRFASDVTPHAGSKILRLYPNDGKMDELAVQPDMGAHGLIEFLWILNKKQMPSFWGNGHIIGDGKWHRLEIYLKENHLGASDGVVRVWLDGALLQELANEVTIAPSDHWGSLHVMSNWSNNPGWDHGANNHVNWDDIQIFSDSGTGASGNMGDATVKYAGEPDAPKRVTIQ
jgi:hypothetical protein